MPSTTQGQAKSPYTPGGTGGAVDFFLKINKIEGESADAKHAKEIDLQKAHRIDVGVPELDGAVQRGVPLEKRGPAPQPRSSRTWNSGLSSAGAPSASRPASPGR